MPEPTTFRAIEEVLSSLAPFVGREVNQICQELGHTMNPANPSRKHLLTRKILERSPAGDGWNEVLNRDRLTVRTVTVDVAGKPNQTLSMGKIDYLRFLDEEWDAVRGSAKYPELRNTLELTRYCLVVFKESASGSEILDRVLTPHSLDWASIEPEVKSIWQRTKQTIHDGEPLQSDGRLDFQWARQSETKYIHIRTAGQTRETRPSPHNGPQRVLGPYVNKDYLEELISSIPVFLPPSHIEDNGISNLSEPDLPNLHAEGHGERAWVNRYERSREARQECLEHWGYECQVCGMDFESRYGEIGREYIHVHHLIPLASIHEGYQVDSILDLKPVCPNCHAMLHREEPPTPVEKLREQLQHHD